MTSQTLGGNQLQTLDLLADGRQLLADGPYVYYRWSASAGGSLTLDSLRSCTLFIRKLTATSAAAVIIRTTGQRHALHQGDAVQIENQDVQVECTAGHIDLLVAGVRNAVVSTPLLQVIANSGIKRVTKPWGHELWINGEHPGYAFKEIFIRAGTKTSLQYHRLKQETNVLFEGQAKLHYKAASAIANDAVKAEHVKTQDLQPGSSVDVPPNTIHRLEATGDVLLYEISTPHLDDVVRLQDDAGRPDGRIRTEHGV